MVYLAVLPPSPRLYISAKEEGEGWEKQDILSEEDTGLQWGIKSGAMGFPAVFLLTFPACKKSK